MSEMLENLNTQQNIYKNKLNVYKRWLSGSTYETSLITDNQKNNCYIKTADFKTNLSSSKL